MRDARVVLVVDCGSASTKAMLLEEVDDKYSLQGMGEAPTTASLGDVTVGVTNAILELEEVLDRQLICEGEIIAPAVGDRGVDRFFAASSADGPWRAVASAVPVGTGAAVENAEEVVRPPGYEMLQHWSDSSLISTSAAVAKGIQIFAKDKGNVIGVDIGGETLDIFSVVKGVLFSTVDAKLGLGSGINLFPGELEDILRWLPFSIATTVLTQWMLNKMVRPGTIPQTLEELLIEQAVGREILRQAFAHHKEQMRVGQAQTPKDFNMMDIDLLIASGGMLAHAPRRVQSAMLLMDALQPEGVTQLMLDSVDALATMGILAKVPEHSLLEQDLLSLGTVIAPGGTARAGESVIRGRVTSSDGSRDIDLLWGEILLIPGEGPFQVELKSHPALDIGAGRGQELKAEVAGGVCGLFLDCRGRPLELATDPDARLRQLLKWYEQVQIYPMFVEGIL